MRSLAMGLLVCLSFLFSACGDNGDDERRRSGGTPLQGAAPAILPLPGEIPNGEIPATGTTGNTYFELLGPELPADVSIIPLQAVLVSPSGQSTVVTSVHRGTRFAPTPISAGTYTLAFLNENGLPTDFRESLVIQPGITNRLQIGSVLISPTSAVQTGRVATTSFPYAISATRGALKTVVPNLNTVVDLPAESFLWQGIGSSGVIPAVEINAGVSLLSQEWGSVFVRKDITDTVAIFSSNGAVLFPETVDGVEYLLPATPQEQGCMVYLGVVNSLTTRTITLCSDAILHVILNER